MRILIVEEALKTLHGHWFQYISDIVNGGREEGYEIEVACHKEACPEILRALPCRPILSATVFDKELQPTGRFGALRRVLAHNRSLYRDLRDFLAKGNSYDVIIATTARLDHLLAHEALRWRFRDRRETCWTLIFIDAIGTYAADYSNIHFSKKTLPLKLAMKLSRLLPAQSHFFLSAESSGMARRFKQFSGLDFSLVPHVTRLPPLDKYREKWKSTEDGRKILATYGFTRYDKGLDILQSAVKQLIPSVSSSNIRFIIQWTGDYSLPDGSLVQKDEILKSTPMVEYLPPFRASEEYYEWVARTHVMVLPYRRDFYYDRLSRVAIDATLAGIPIVYPAGTWLEWFVENHATGVAFKAEDPASLARAMQEAIARYPELKAGAEARKQAASEAFSARKFFLDIAKSLAGK
jgi:glycosyltransferase involved in cell wall biosynthesis